MSVLSRSASRPAGRKLTPLLLLMVLAVFCRGLLAAPLGVHAGTAEIDALAKAVEHGHYHAPLLDHFHSESAGISDSDHKLLHNLGAFDSQLALPYSSATAARAHTLLIASTIRSLPESPRAGPYRPPKV